MMSRINGLTDKNIRSLVGGKDDVRVSFCLLVCKMFPVEYSMA